MKRSIKQLLRKCATFLLALVLLTSCGQQAQATWQEQYDLGMKYLEEGSYEEAILAFTAAIEIDPRRAEAYISLADAHVAAGSYEEALAVLEAALEQADDTAAVQAKLEELENEKRQEDQEREEAERAEQAEQARQAALQALEGMPYDGDLSRCRMTAEQALAFAGIIADGISGRIAPFDEYGSPESPLAFWEEPYSVWGYGGPYETDRALVALADLAGDGVPYLVVSSSLVDGESFEIYGWKDGEAFRVTGAECYGGRQGVNLWTGTDGRSYISTGGSAGAAHHLSEDYVFVNGGMELVYSWEEEYLEDGRVRLVENGVETIYTWEEYEARPSSSPLPEAVPESPDGSGAVEPCPLREMLDGLNRYAQLVSGGEAAAVAIPALTETQQAAKAMLELLNEANSGDPYMGILQTRLLDLNGDGRKELFVLTMEGVLYFWQDGALQSKSVGYYAGGSLNWYLCRDTQTGEMGIEYESIGGGDFSGGSRTYYYLSRTVEISDINDNYHVDGAEATKEQYDAAAAQNQRLEAIGGDVLYSADNRLEKTVAELLTAFGQYDPDR